ncbi:Hypothetical predicted protein, partial [Olea europaea subsp. europaea]
NKAGQGVGHRHHKRENHLLTKPCNARTARACARSIGQLLTKRGGCSTIKKADVDMAVDYAIDQMIGKTAFYRNTAGLMRQ